MKPEDGREEMIRRNVLGTLKKVQEVLDSMEKAPADPERFCLSETHASVYGGRYYDVFVPEGYRIAEATEGYRFLMYRPNPANPDRYEASDTILYEAEEPIEAVEGRSGNRFLVQKKVDAGNRSHVFTAELKNVKDTEESVLRSFAEALFQTITF